MTGRMSTGETEFDAERVRELLSGTPFDGRLEFFPSITSTNTVALSEAGAGAPEWSTYIADEQTAGRGRGSHTWHSPLGSGLYVSILLRPKIAPADALWLSLAAGLAVQSAVLQVCGVRPDIRWPNDLLIRGKKFCGILSEIQGDSTRTRHAVVGIGMNVNQEGFPDELALHATSLRIETGKPQSREDLLVALLNSLAIEFTALVHGVHGREFLNRVEQASSWVRGKQVYVEEAGGFAGITDGLDEHGFLRVDTTAGIRTVLTGGVREA
jgi:BirA family transcriptional regulator, biotin operon repressor / biotin---[acetyl-CoA-carboxylase] ligase